MLGEYFLNVLEKISLHLWPWTFRVRTFKCLSPTVPQALGTRGKSRIILKLFTEPCTFIFKFKELLAKPTHSRSPKRQCTRGEKTLVEMQTSETFTTQMPAGQSDKLILRSLSVRGIPVLIRFPVAIRNTTTNSTWGKERFLSSYTSSSQPIIEESQGRKSRSRGRNDGGELLTALLHCDHSVVIIHHRLPSLGMVPPSSLGPPTSIHNLKKNAQIHAQRPTWWKQLLRWGSLVS